MTDPNKDPETGQPGTGDPNDLDNPDLFSDPGQDPDPSKDPEPTVDELKAQAEEARKRAEDLERDYKELQGQTTRKEQEVVNLRKQLANTIDPDRAGQPQPISSNPEERINQNLKRLDKAIEENKRLGFRTDELEAQRDSTEMLLDMVRANRRDQEFSMFYGSKENADLKPDDYEAIGNVMTEYEKKGTPVSIHAAKEIWLGRTAKDRTEAAIKEALEGKGRGDRARGMQPGIPATPREPSDEDDMHKFAGEVGNPDGIDIPPEAYKNR